MKDVRHLYVLVDGVEVFYREAGDPERPTLLLLHGFPASSIQFRYMLAELSDRWHLVAPDLPGFGFTRLSVESGYEFTFDNLAATMRAFIDRLRLTVFAAYLHDYGAHVGFRLLTEGAIRPHALIIQNTEAYHGVGWRDLMWAMEKRLTDSPEDARSRLRKELLNKEGIRKEFTEDLPSDIADRIDPAVVELAWNRMNDPRTIEAMLDLHMDYGSNIQRYSAIQGYFRSARPSAFLLWGKRDQYVSMEAAQAYSRDLPGMELTVLDGGHWLLESHFSEITAAVHAYLSKRLP
ncbi:MAG: alpha/beta hydrolase [Phycisphaerales bacterium]